MVFPRRRSIISQEERINRLKESRQKYNRLAKKSTKPPTVPIAPRASIAPKQSVAPMVSMAPQQSIAQNSSTALRNPVSQVEPEDDFKIDQNSLDMIKSGRIVIPVNRPSIAAPRHTFGARESLIGKPMSRFRASIASREPRVSLMPLGINVFEANSSQRNEVSEFLNNITSGATPGKPSSTNNSLNTTGNRQRKIRFFEVESAIQEARESAEADGIAACSSSDVRHSPISDLSFKPTSILSTKKADRKKINLANCPSKTPRTVLNFDETDSMNDSLNQEMEEKEKENHIQVISFQTVLSTLCDLKPGLSKYHIALIEKSIENWKNISAVKSPEKNSHGPIPITPLGSILEAMNIAEEDSDVQEYVPEKKKKRRSSMMKAGAVRRRSTLRRSARGLFKQD